MPRSSRALATIAFAVWVLIALGAAVLARGASERPPFEDESELVKLASVSCVAAAVLVVGLWRRWSPYALVPAWGVQAGVLLAALVITQGDSTVRIAPPVVAAGIAGELAGALAIILTAVGRESP